MRNARRIALPELDSLHDLLACALRRPHRSRRLLAVITGLHGMLTDPPTSAALGPMLADPCCWPRMGGNREPR